MQQPVLDIDIFDPQLELHEARAWAELYRWASDEARRECGVERFSLGSAQGTLASAVDILAFNRVIGLGVQEPATEAMVEETVGRYADAGVKRFFVQLAPQSLPTALPDWLTARGFRHHNNWMKLFRDLSAPPRVESDLRVEIIDRHQAATFAAVIAEAFEWPERVRPWLAGLFGRPGWTHYLAFDGDLPVATAAMFIQGSYCWLDFASTRASHRGRGAQSALIARRIRDAAAQGSRLLVVETAEDLPDRPAPSCRNLQRFGFQVAYTRPNYLFSAG